MEKTKQIMVWLLMVSAAAVGAESAGGPNKGVMVMFQDALYQEQTAGDLDKAIELYQKVLAESGEVERLAARATFQLGVCYLKKGDKEKAAEYFGKVVSDYPAQKELAGRAAKQLEKIEPKFKKSDLTQEMYNDIQPDGTIKFRNPMCIVNSGSEPIFENRFINSDFVKLTAMLDKQGKPVDFTATHEGSIYRYHVRFEPPIKPGETFLYYTEGTISGLVSPVKSQKDTYRYYMKHSPATGKPTLRIEQYLLPQGAELLSTFPEDIQRGEKDGRIELRVEKVVPANGSITTSFTYRLAKSNNQEAKDGLNKAAEQQKQTVEKAVMAAQAWLELVDKGQFGKSWDEAAGFFRMAVSKKQWETAVGAARKPLGDFVSREVLTSSYTRQMPGAPDGEYVIIQFKAAYANKKEAIETVTPMLDSDGQWRVSGYFVK